MHGVSVSMLLVYESNIVCVRVYVLRVLEYVCVCLHVFVCVFVSVCVCLFSTQLHTSNVRHYYLVHMKIYSTVHMLERGFSRWQQRTQNFAT